MVNTADQRPLVRDDFIGAGVGFTASNWSTALSTVRS